MTGLVLVLAALVGLVVGSFVNVLVHRVPSGVSVVRPRSACPACTVEIRWYDNVPVVSWLVLKGRCRSCRAPISPRYPAVEALTAVLFALVAVRLVIQDDLLPALPAFLYVIAMGVALAFIDAEHRRLPNAIVLPSYVFVAGLLVLASAIEADTGAMLRALIGGAASWALYFVLMVIKPGGMGFGDVKLAGVLGGALGWLGWGSLVVGTFGAFLVGGLVAIGLVLVGRAGRKSRIPFGPWMVIGAVLGILVGEAVWGAYLALLG